MGLKIRPGIILIKTFEVKETPWSLNTNYRLKSGSFCETSKTKYSTCVILDLIESSYSHVF